MGIVRVMKRWWLIALVFTLALSLTSCAKRNADLQSGPNYGFGYCDGTLGSFDIYVIPSPSDPNMFQLAIMPVSLTDPGDIVQVVMANQSPSYQIVDTEAVLQPNQELDAGYISATDLSNYNILSIVPFDGTGQTFLQQSPNEDVTCSLPSPSDNSSGAGAVGAQAMSLSVPRTSLPSGL